MVEGIIKNCGEASFDSADDANIPVDIWLRPIEKEYQRVEEIYGEDDSPPVRFTPTWELKASNYMPRRAAVEEGEAFYAVADNREELIDIVKNTIIPIYKKALVKLERICEGTEDNLYYWD